MGRRLLPSLNSLRAFEAFARLGSMSVAAEELCVTYGAVSRHVRGLEARLGVALTEGPKHQLRLTDAGHKLANALLPAFDMIAAGLPGAGQSEELVVSCYGTLAMKWLIPRLPGFLDSNPNLQVRILESHAPVDFAQGGFHAAIRILEPGESGPYRSLLFMDHYHGPVLSPALLADFSLGQLLMLPRLHSGTFRRAWVQWAGLAGVNLPNAVATREFEHNSYMLEAAAAGMGVAVAPWAFAAADIERGRLIAPLGFQPINARFAYLRPRLGENDAARMFGEWLRREGKNAACPPPAKEDAFAALISVKQQPLSTRYDMQEVPSQVTR